MNALRVLLATWFGCGFAPLASGTVGTAATVPLVLLLWRVGSWPWHIAVTLAVIALGVWAAGDAELRWGRKDPGQVVIDESAGFLIATIALPASGWILLASFLVFRAFDVVKPWPARRLERWPGAWGIMADDLIAGLYANIVVRFGLFLGLGAWSGWR
ncbi:MAG: phosphatidylglycerophosphatase A [Acidobacteriota bacterium]|nr:MAG: phosphatidylglycerophosphatase A [Acidobacteriota bacterium]